LEGILATVNELLKLGPGAIIAVAGLGAAYGLYSRRVRVAADFTDQAALFEKRLAERDQAHAERIKELRDEYTDRLLAATAETDEYRKLHEGDVERQDRIAAALEVLLGVKMPK
jgi:hypothetical protein